MITQKQREVISKELLMASVFLILTTIQMKSAFTSVKTLVNKMNGYVDTNSIIENREIVELINNILNDINKANSQLNNDISAFTDCLTLFKEESKDELD